MRHRTPSSRPACGHNRGLLESVQKRMMRHLSHPLITIINSHKGDNP
jgi:hypothetical protein